MKQVNNQEHHDPFNRLITKRFAQLLTRRLQLHTLPYPGEPPKHSIYIRHVDCGSCNVTELEIASLFGPVYDAERFGFHLVASPRHADILLLTGPLTRNMLGAVLEAFWAMPEPRKVITVGDEFNPSGVYQGGYGIVPIPDEIIPTWIAHIRGDPPSPQQILGALLEIFS